MKKILITGGNSFLARSFIPFLEDSHQLVVLTRNELDLNDADAVATCLKQHHFDVVIHTATYDAAPKDSPKDPKQVLENNLRMFFNLARHHNQFGKMIYFGSGAEFGRENWTENMTESQFDIAVPNDQYGFSKYVMNQHALLSNNIYNLRLFGVFGELDDWRYRIVSNLCCHAIVNHQIYLHQNSRMDLLYINDLARIVLWFIENQPRHHDYNVCRGISDEFKVIANLIAELSGGEVGVSVKHHDFGKVYGGNNQRLLAELKSFEFTPLSSALNNMLNWYQHNRAMIDAKQFHF